MTSHHVVGGYSNWTPAEQREWDRDLEKLEAERDEQELNETEKVEKTIQQNGDNQELSWLELAIDFPLFHVTYRRIGGTDMYVIDLKQVSQTQPGVQNWDFEVVYPLYQGLNEILQLRKTPKTTLTKIEVS